MSRSARAMAPETLVVDAAAHDGRGIAHVDGKVVFVQGALPGETVEVLRHRRKRGFDEAEVIRVLEPSPARVVPRCAHYGVCGGCVLQHAGHPLQLTIKQQALADNLARIGKVAPTRWLAPITGPIWGYRRRARLSCRYVDKKGRTLVGFRERGRPYVADLAHCDVLSDPVGGLLQPLAAMLGAFRQPRAIAQVEIAVGDGATALVLRHLEPLPSADLDSLRSFGAQHGVQFYLQPGGYDSITPLQEGGPGLSYRLEAHDVEIRFEPTDFVQVNGAVNEQMVDAALTLLAPSPAGAYLDLFSGLGNFTLPLARRAARVTGVEGDAGLVARARENARHNGLGAVTFHAANLFAPDTSEAWMRARYDGILLDPPRAGAREILSQVEIWQPGRIVYVSCHPGTLARDAGELVTRFGYTLAAAGIIDMFPHTAHVESIALFER